LILLGQRGNLVSHCLSKLSPKLKQRTCQSSGGSSVFLLLLHHEAAIAFPTVLLYGLFCFNKETLLPVSITRCRSQGTTISPTVA